jgi:DNA-binding transcriptional regulator YiaG
VDAQEDDASPAQGLRFRVAGFANLRKKLGLSAAEMGKLMGVSAQSVYHWETGKSRPRAAQLAAIAAVRKLGKREVAQRLAV